MTCDGCASDLTAKIYYIATTAEYTPPVIYSQEERHKLVYLVQARPNKPDLLRVGQPVSVDAGRRRKSGVARRQEVTQVSSCKALRPSTRPRASGGHRHRRARPVEIVQRPQGRQRPVDAGEARRDLRLPRTERLRQDDDDPHAVRPADAGLGRGHLPRLRHPHGGRQDQAPCRLHDAEVQPLSGPVGAREPRIRRAPVRPVDVRAPRRAT